MPGTLYIVATPIGNLDDISLRALEILKSVDYIAAEDTRHSRKLLNHFGINTSLKSLHNFNEERRSKLLLHDLTNEKNIALISDAGTPLINDPGFEITRLAHANDIKVAPIPGPCALISALSVAGLPTDSFTFLGFLPPKKGARQKKLAACTTEKRTLIFYESSHRIVAATHDMVTIFGPDRYAVIAREMTKTFETIHGDTLANLHLWLQANPKQQKGEFVILLHGAPKKIAQTMTPEADRVLKILTSKLPPKLAIELTAEITSLRKKVIKSHFASS
jgi:16S rRNA (cytidine1402-2'-O)-methyltransferase